MKKLYTEPKLNRYGTVEKITLRRQRGRRRDRRARRRISFTETGS